jgi:hypothetical protein
VVIRWINKGEVAPKATSGGPSRKTVLSPHPQNRFIPEKSTKKKWVVIGIMARKNAPVRKRVKSLEFEDEDEEEFEEEFEDEDEDEFEEEFEDELSATSSELVFELDFELILLPK